MGLETPGLPKKTTHFPLFSAGGMIIKFRLEVVRAKTVAFSTILSLCIRDASRMTRQT